MKNPNTIPLITDIEKLSIGHYLATSGFERLAVNQGFGEVWQVYYRHILEERRVFMLDHDHKPGDCENTLLLLIEKLYEIDKNVLHKILYSTLHGFIEWNFNELDLNDVFEDLTLINFPKDWLDSLRRTYLDKNRIILDNQKLNHLSPEDENFILTKNEILKTKKSEWIRLLGKGEVKEVIDELIENTDNFPRFRNELVNQSSRFHRILKRFREGTIDIDTEMLEINKINKALLEIIDQL